MLPGFTGGLISGQYFESRLLKDAHARGQTLDSFQSVLRGFRRDRHLLGPVSSLRAMLDCGAAPLVRALGYGPPGDISSVRNAVGASLHGGVGCAALLVTSWGDQLDHFWRTAVTEALRRSAAWCLLFNGSALRIVNARRLYSRRYAEFDLDLALEDPRAFAALWSLARAEITCDPMALDALVDDSDRHSAAVSRSLRTGVLSASRDLVHALFGAQRASRGVARSSLPGDAFEQALTIVYRMLFLLFAEARGLVPVWHRVYRESYSLESMRDAAVRSTRAAGSWDTLRAIARLAHAGCHAGDLRVTPFNGRLFAPARTPLADRRGLDDGAARRALLALSTQASVDGGSRERIAYRDLGVEQLGAVYETLLDYTPRIERRVGAAPAVVLESGSGIRKQTGTFYTPQPLADYLVRRTLAPLTATATPERILQLRIVDPAMGSGAFLVAACRFMAAAYEAALIREGGCHQGGLNDAERTRIRRLIAERCLYGVDLNPMAVQLARLSLWLTTLAAGRPLTFLDHRLHAGDSLLGAWLSNLRHTPARRRHAPPMPLPLFETDALHDLMGAVLPTRFILESTPDDTIAQVREKERVHAALDARGTTLAKWKRVADLWCATWFATESDALPPSAFPSMTDVVLGGHSALPRSAAETYLAASDRISGRRQFFHWELEFPEVFFEHDGSKRADGGFDAVLGNPPWDMVRSDSGPADRRVAARSESSAFIRFTRQAGIYSAQSDGHANRYQMFLERAIDLTRPSGRIGLVLPAGLIIDRGSAALRRRLLSQCEVDALVGFDNRARAFPVHRSVRFLLATATVGAPTRSIGCRFGESNVAALDTPDADAPSWFPLQITPAFLERVSGEELSIPWLQGAVDLAILERATSLFPALGGRDGWGVRFGRELNATDDRDALRPPGQGLPVVEGKQVWPFRIDLAAVRFSTSANDAARRIGDARFAFPRLCYRDVASATNRLTLIAAVLPGGCVSTHTVFCLRTSLRSADQHLLCGLFNSFIVNYLVRLRVSTHVTTAIVERLPIPQRNRFPRVFGEIAATARLLAGRDDADAKARLEASVAAMYQLTTREFEHVLSTFPLIPAEERNAAYRAFAARARVLEG
jgi:hypothetical protein